MNITAIKILYIQKQKGKNKLTTIQIPTKHSFLTLMCTLLYETAWHGRIDCKCI